MKQKRLAFLTMENLEGYFTYDHLASEILKQRGWTVDDVPWRSQTDWSNYSHAIIRSTWDYQNHLEEFLTTLEQIERQGTIVLNSLKTVKWNLNKRYLLELHSGGVPIVPTIHGCNLRETELPELAKRLGTKELILKPLVGANADGIFRIPSPFDGQPAQDAVSAYCDSEYFAQPFLPSIQSEGEYSLFFYLNEYCNGVNKRPKSGDFRVQEEHGGLLSSFHPEQEMIDISRAALDCVPEQTLYARVDLVRCPDGSYGVIEVEVIEPSLYFNMDPNAPVMFADAVEKVIQG